MNKGILILIIATFFITGCTTTTTPQACTMEAKLCPDGSAVGRNSFNNCEFDPCPEIEYCDANNPCSPGKDCYDFPGQKAPFCFTGDPCIKCPNNRCNVMESYPMQVVCTEQVECFKQNNACCKPVGSATYCADANVMCIEGTTPLFKGCDEECVPIVECQ